MKKVLSMVLTLAFVFSLFTLPVRAEEISGTGLIPADVIDLGELTDEPIEIRVPLGDSLSKTQSTQYLIFTITKTHVYWEMLSMWGSDYTFNGFLNITNITAGHACTRNLAMSSSGSTSYEGWPGNQYLLQFDGKVYKNGKLIYNNEHGSWTWKVPVD